MPAENPMGLSPPIPVSIANSASTSTPSVFASVFSSSGMSQPSQTPATSSFSNQISALDGSFSACGVEPTSLSLSPYLHLSNSSCSLLSKADQSHIHYAPSPQPAMSATALLQKAAQMGATSPTPSFLSGLGLAVSFSSSGLDANGKQDNNSAFAATGRGLGLSSGLTDAMMDPSSLFGSKPTTLDLLGLGIGAGGASTSGLSALLTSFGSGFNVGASPASYGRGRGRGNLPGEQWEGAPDRKPNGPALP